MVDLGDPAILSSLGVSSDDLTTEDYAVPQDLGGRFFRAGVTGLLVPAALRATALLYPRFRMVRDGQVVVHDTPATGVNVVLYPDNLHRGDAYPEVERFICLLAPTKSLRPSTTIPWMGSASLERDRGQRSFATTTPMAVMRSVSRVRRVKVTLTGWRFPT